MANKLIFDRNTVSMVMFAAALTPVGKIKCIFCFFADTFLHLYFLTFHNETFI